MKSLLAGIIIILFAALIYSATLCILTPKAEPPVPVCKVCHCGQEQCARTCSEENMCQMRCERECKR